jgi:hypothetical protein
MHYLVLLCLVFSLACPFASFSSPYSVGPKLCLECHKSEYEIWNKTEHTASFRDLHKNAKVADVLAAVGGDKNIRKNTLCAQCHYTLEQADESSPATAKTGISRALTREKLNRFAQQSFTKAGRN